LKATIAFLVFVVALALGYALGTREDGATGANTASPPRPLDTGQARNSDRSQGSSGPQASNGGMTEPAFWQLMADTRSAARNDTGRQSELLEQRLRRLPPRQIVDFQRIRHRLDEQAYTWKLWGAAYVIDDGCSDDCFRDFRAYLISLGSNAYEEALRDPDSLAPVAQDAETGNWESADSVAADAYENATGEDIPADDSDLSGSPRGEPWDDEDQEALVQRYPALAARF
jgi:Protein of unknown function (DUF4240)